jgi:hypothetical protein
MKQIIQQSLLRISNALHYQFHSDVLRVVTAQLAAGLKFGAQRDNYAALFKLEDETFIRNQAYAETKTVEELDLGRDNLSYYIKQTIESYLLYPDPEKKAAAEKLNYVLHPYREAARATYAENTAQINSLLIDFQKPENVTLLTKLGLTEAVQLLQKANDNFNAAYTGRSGAKLTRVESDNMKSIRPKVDEAYQEITATIDALFRINEMIEKDAAKAEVLSKMIDDINAHIIQLKQTMAAHRTKDEEEETEEKL